VKVCGFAESAGIDHAGSKKVLMLSGTSRKDSKQVVTCRFTINGTKGAIVGNLFFSSSHFEGSDF
jgi:hypothetical protein